jgi:hypothetical protein
LLARNSIRFIRNHDTVGNEENIGGLGGFSLRAAAVATAWLLAVHDGIPLVLADDVLESKLIRQAARYRQQVKAFCQTMQADDVASVWTDVRVRGARKGRQPGLVCIAIRERIDCDANTQHDGPCIGFAVLNPTIDDAAGRYNGAKQGLTLTFRGSACLEGSVGMKFAAIVDNDVALNAAKTPMATDAVCSLVAGASARPRGPKKATATSLISIAPCGKLLDAELSVPPSSGLFFLREGIGQSVELAIDTEDECVAWSIIDDAFNAPGTSLERKGEGLGEWVHVEFTLLSAETDYGQQIVLCGSAAELGNWSPEQGIILTTDATSYPMWRCSVTFASDSLNEPVYYKYIRDYRGCGGGFDWECSDRSVQMSSGSERSYPDKEGSKVCAKPITKQPKEAKISRVEENEICRIEEHDLGRIMGA